jgi:uncharacterized DUF497 family protein
MAVYDWDDAKNAQLKDERGIGFEEVLTAIDAGMLLGAITHPNRGRYPKQRIFIVKIGDYAYSVPYVPAEENFLKTIYPSRKFTKKYIGNGGDA